MLCKINATVGGATDEKARAINFLRAIQAICTAPAGSTPSVASVTTPTASPVIGTAGSANVITEVISNVEAGGWTASASSNVTANYNASAAVPYQVDLYRDSGKAAYPFRKLSFRSNPVHLFNGAYTSYPVIGVTYGFNTAQTATGNYLLVQRWNSLATDGVYSRNYFDVNFYDGNDNNDFRPAAGEWLIASTDRYFIALSGGLADGPGHPGSMMYVGLRTTNTWEDQYDDNPPLGSVYYSGSSRPHSGNGQNASMWCRTLGPTGTVNSQPAWYRIQNVSDGSFNGVMDQSGNNLCPLSGWNNQGNAVNQFSTNPRYHWANQMQVPMLPGGWGMMRSKYRENTQVVGPVTDPTTGVAVPPAYPITFARNLQSSHNSGGTAIGIYKSLSGTDTFMQYYYTPGQTFVVNNEAYYAYAIGNNSTYRDLFLIRKY